MRYRTRGRCSIASRALIPVLLAALVMVGGPVQLGGAIQDTTPSPDLLAQLGDDGQLSNCVDPSFPPMEYFQDQNATEPIGFDIDLVNEIAQRLGVEATHTATEFTGLLPALEAGRCDIVASGLYLTAERLATFAAQPYYDTSVVIMTPSDNDDIAAPEDLAGKTVAVQAGTNYVNILNDLNSQLRAAGQSAVNVQTYPKQTDAIQQLVVGRAEATITQDTEAAFRESAQPGEFKIAYTYPDPQTFGIYYRKQNTALGAALKSAVEQMRDDGAIAGIAQASNLPEEGAQYSVNVYGGATPEASPAA